MFSFFEASPPPPPIIATECAIRQPDSRGERERERKFQMTGVYSLGSILAKGGFELSLLHYANSKSETKSLD